MTMVDNLDQYNYLNNNLVIIKNSTIIFLGIVPKQINRDKNKDLTAKIFIAILSLKQNIRKNKEF
jgi:hypothetical protein